MKKISNKKQREKEMKKGKRKCISDIKNEHLKRKEYDNKYDRKKDEDSCHYC